MVSTADPEFYKRTQRQFLQMYHQYFDHTEQKAKPIIELRKILQGTNTSKKVLILDGFGGDGTSNWIPWLKKELQSQ